MKLEDKKFLAEWMGWQTFCTLGPVAKSMEEIKHGEDWEVMFSNSDWNPDTDHQQFAEVWNRLDDRQRYDVIDMHLRMNRDGVRFISEVLNNLPAVMDAVLEALKDNPKQED
jgi:hypothetical protein